jgi:hypothetical protein
MPLRGAHLCKGRLTGSSPAGTVRSSLLVRAGGDSVGITLRPPRAVRRAADRGHERSPRLRSTAQRRIGRTLPWYVVAEAAAVLAPKRAVDADQILGRDEQSRLRTQTRMILGVRPARATTGNRRWPTGHRPSARRRAHGGATEGCADHRAGSREAGDRVAEGIRQGRQHPRTRPRAVLHRALTESGAPLRGRGGATRGKTEGEAKQGKARQGKARQGR